MDMEKVDEPLLPRSFWQDPAQREHDVVTARNQLDLQEKAWNMMVSRWPVGTSFGSAPPPAPAWQPPPGLSGSAGDNRSGNKEG